MLTPFKLFENEKLGNALLKKLDEKQETESLFATMFWKNSYISASKCFSRVFLKFQENFSKKTAKKCDYL